MKIVGVDPTSGPLDGVVHLVGPGVAFASASVQSEGNVLLFGGTKFASNLAFALHFQAQSDNTRSLQTVYKVSFVILEGG